MFFAVGIGAILQVISEVGRLIVRSQANAGADVDDIRRRRRWHCGHVRNRTAGGCVSAAGKDVVRLGG